MNFQIIESGTGFACWGVSMPLCLWLGSVFFYACSLEQPSTLEDNVGELNYSYAAPALNFGPFKGWDLSPEGLAIHFRTFYPPQFSLANVGKLNAFRNISITDADKAKDRHRLRIQELGYPDPMPEFSLEMEQTLPNSSQPNDTRWTLFDYYAPSTVQMLYPDQDIPPGTRQWQNTEQYIKLALFQETKQKQYYFRLFNHDDYSRKWRSELIYEDYSNSYEITTAGHTNNMRELFQHQKTLTDLFYRPGEHALEDQPLFHYHISFFLAEQQLPWLENLVVQLDEFVGILAAAYSPFLMSKTTSSPWIAELMPHTEWIFSKYIREEIEEDSEIDTEIEQTLAKEMRDGISEVPESNSFYDSQRTIPTYRNYKNHYVGLRGGIYSTNIKNNRIGIEIRGLRPVAMIPVAKWVMTLFVYALYHPDEPFKFGRLGSAIANNELLTNTKRFSWAFHQEQVKALVGSECAMDTTMAKIDRWTFPLLDLENNQQRPYLISVPQNIQDNAKAAREAYYLNVKSAYVHNPNAPELIWNSMHTWAETTPLTHYAW